MRFLGVAFDGGARDVLQAVSETVDLEAVSALSRVSFRNSCDELLSQDRWRGLLIATSTSIEGRQAEQILCVLAYARRLKLATVEDYPGNFQPVPGAKTNLLIVESMDAKVHAIERWGSECLEIAIIPPIRYDKYRRRINEMRLLSECGRQKIRSDTTGAVLWIGQPETEDCFRTLEAMLPTINALHLTLLFKAHPRDRGYVTGAYSPLFQKIYLPVRDVTNLPLDEIVPMGLDLVLTQYSSMAIDAGFWGVPSLNVLLPDLGGKRLKETKGYSIPLHCAAGGAYVVTDAKSLRAIFTEAMSDVDSRRRIIKGFDEYFCAEGVVGEAFGNLLNDYFP